MKQWSLLVWLRLWLIRQRLLDFRISLKTASQREQTDALTHLSYLTRATSAG